MNFVVGKVQDYNVNILEQPMALPLVCIEELVI